MQDVPKIVRARLLKEIPFTAESHPDADLLTAFAEHTLAEQERDRLVEHLSRCSDCRDIVVLALPATEAVVIGGSDVRERAGWLNWSALNSPAFRWSVVAAGLLIVSSVGALQYRQHHAEKMLVATTLMPRNAVPDNTSPSLPSSAQTFVSQTTPSSAEMGKPMEARPKTATRSRNTIEPVVKAKPAGTQESPVGMATPPLLRADPTLMQGHVTPRWMVSPGGALQRSLDGGKTWLNVNVIVDDSTKSKAQPTIFRVVSVSANASEVWAGGSGSALYHTADGGSRWTRVVPSTAGGILTGDIVGIQFSDPQSGTVNTSTSEIWITTDAGQTWDKQQ
jgi:hypothetical protein